MPENKKQASINVFFQLIFIEHLLDARHLVETPLEENPCPDRAYILLGETGNKQDDYLKHILRQMV